MGMTLFVREISQLKVRQVLILALGIITGMLGLGLAGGCAPNGPLASFSRRPSLTAPKVRWSRPQVFVRPHTDRYRQRRVAIFNFNGPPGQPEVGEALARIFHRKLLQMGIFPEVILVAPPGASGRDPRRLARDLGADLILTGEVPYFMDTGTTGTSGLQVELRLEEALSGRTVWHLSLALNAAPQEIKDLWVTETKPEPTPSVYALADLLAERLCAILAGGR